MTMNPRTHRRGAPPDFSMDGLPANPNPGRITNALWWLRCMRLRLEPLSQDGGIYAPKPGYHSHGSRLPDYGQGDSRTDHSIRRAPDRSGPWWQSYASAHDWTFTRAHSGVYTEIDLYTSRLIKAMQDPSDLRPDEVYAYTIGQADNDRVVEGYNEYTDDPESGDESHLFHRHDSFRRNIVGSFAHMWRALTIDMGWTYAEYLQSIKPVEATVTTPTSAQMTSAATAGVLGYAGGGLPTWAEQPAGRNFLNAFTEAFRELKEQDTDLDAVGASVVVITAMLSSVIQDPYDMDNPEAHPIVAAVRYVLENPRPAPAGSTPAAG